MSSGRRGYVARLIAACVATNFALSQPAVAKTFMWKVETKAAEVYLLGSVHVAEKTFYPLSDTINSAFASCENVVFEIPLDIRTQMESSQKMLDAAMYPAGDSLDKHVRPDLYAALTAYAASNQLGIAFLRRTRPWFVAVTVTFHELGRQGFNPMFGIDMHFANRSGDKTMLALETVESQVAVFSEMDPGVQEAFLEQALLQTGAAAAQLRAMLKAWSAGDGPGLQKIMVAQLGEEPRFEPIYKAMLTDRNILMAKKIEGYLKAGGTYFVVVGAGHIVGDDGIVELLRAKKYRVRQQ